ncbi:MAG: hypothetical protein MUO67_21295 [Anaerolineales bacterium]|nr:hypothetical protein [Anaerolineales bacterium]
MSLAIPIFTLLLIVLIMLVIRLLRENFAFYWLIATVGAFIAWPMVLIMGTQLPQTQSLIAWKPETLFPSSLVLTADRISWPYAVVLITLVLALMLTEVARATESMWSSWAAGLLLGGLGIFAVFAGNPLTLLLAWTAIDLVELLILLRQSIPKNMRERVVVAFSVRILGSGLLMAAVLVTSSAGLEWTFANIPSQAAVLLLLAVGLRLGVLLAYMPILRESTSRRSLGSMLHLVPAAASLVLLNRTAFVVEPSTIVTVLLLFVGLTAIYAGASWIFATDEIEGAPSWILGMASLSAAAAMLAQPIASQAWGIGVLLSGGLIFYTSVLERRMSWLLLLGFIGISALPFTPSWNGALMYAPPFKILMVIFVIAQVLLMVGYIRHTLRTREGFTNVERWVRLIYPLGLAILPLTHFLYGWWAFVGFENLLLSSWLLGIITLLLTALIVGVTQFGPKVSFGRVAAFESFFSLQWFYSLIWMFIRAVENVIQFLTTVLEGEGGLLWAFLMLVMLFLAFAAMLGGI